MKNSILIIFILATLAAADQPDVVIDKRFIYGSQSSTYDWMIDSVDTWGWGIEIDSVVSGYYTYPTTKVAIICMGPHIDSLDLEFYRNDLHRFVSDGGRLLVPLEFSYYPTWYTWQRDCNSLILNENWLLGMNARNDCTFDSLRGFTFFSIYQPSCFSIEPPIDSIFAYGVDSIVILAGPTVEFKFPSESLFIGNFSSFSVGFTLRRPIVLGARSFYGNGEVIIFENNMFGFRSPVDSLSIAAFDTALHYNTQFLRNLLTTPVQPHEQRVFRGVPFLLHTQIESLDPTGLFDDIEFFPAWIGTLYAWERQVADLGEPFAEFLSDSFAFRYIITPGGDFSVGPVSGDLDSAILTLVFGRQRTPFNWERFLTESDRLCAPWIAPEPMQSLLGIALRKEIEHLAENGHIDYLTYLRADDCTDSFALSLTDSSVLGFENRPYTFENRTGKPIWILSSAIKHYRSSAMFLETPCWWERYPLCDRPDWEYRRRGNLSWSPLASDANADTSGSGARGFALHWSGDSASAVSYTGHFISSGAGTLFVSGTPISPAMPCTTRWCAIDYWHSDFEMNYLVTSRYIDSEFRMAIAADSVWTSGVWESPCGIGGNPEPLLVKLPSGTTTFPGGGSIDITPAEITVFSGDSSAFVVHSSGPETLHVGWICASRLDISPKHAVVPPGDSIVFWTTYDGITLAHDTILIYSDDPQTPIYKVFATAFYGIGETPLPEGLSVSVSPNPFNAAVSINAPEKAEIEIFDIEGRKIGELPGGSQVWKPEASVGSGIYLVRAIVGEQEVTKRVVYLK